VLHEASELVLHYHVIGLVRDLCLLLQFYVTLRRLRFIPHSLVNVS
jgi:hypothetical protein